MSEASLNHLRNLQLWDSSFTQTFDPDNSGSLTYDGGIHLYPPTKAQLQLNLWKEQTKNMTVIHDNNAEHSVRVVCNTIEDLSPDHILDTLVKIRGRLMFEINPSNLKTLKCRMTPKVKSVLITANRRLAMYGKHRPYVACFDEYGNRLPDRFEFEDGSKMTVQIIDSPNRR